MGKKRELKGHQQGSDDEEANHTTARKPKPKGSAKAKKQPGGGGHVENWTASVDPRRIRFQYAKIRPVFSGCGRAVEETLDMIRDGQMKVDDLPMIQVIQGPEEDGDFWYFSLNNRRLWVLKQLREEGALVDDRVQVRVRSFKSDVERQRFSIENCSLNAKVVREKQRAPEAAQGEDVDAVEEPAVEEAAVVPDGYYYNDGGERKGPETGTTMAELWLSGKVTENTKVWCKGQEGGWKTVREVLVLHSALVALGGGAAVAPQGGKKVETPVVCVCVSNVAVGYDDANR